MTLADFVARLRTDYRNPPREDEAATTDEAGEAVRLMTIHQAKGLEFPIVVLPDLNRKPPASRAPITFQPDLGPILKPPEDDSIVESREGGESLGYLLQKQIELREEETEALCLFYVATTRARDALVLSAGMAPDEAPVSPALKLLAGRFDLATGACRTELPLGCNPPSLRVVDQEPAPLGTTTHHSKRSRPRLNRVARIIASAPPAATTPNQQMPAPTSFPRPRPRARSPAAFGTC